MSHHILALNTQSRMWRANIGPFQWDQARQKFIWGGKVLATAEELAEAVNDGGKFLKNYDNPDLEMRAQPVPAEQAEAVSAQAPEGATPRKRLVVQRPELATAGGN